MENLSTSFHAPKKQLFSEDQHPWVDNWDVRQRETIVALNKTRCPKETVELMQAMKDLREEYFDKLMGYKK